MRLILRRLATAVAAAHLALVAACTTIPATGERAFLALSPAQEQAIGRSEHPKLVAAFGGEYADPELQVYVNEIGQRLVRASETPEALFTFTVLDSPIVNAFALPGGYIHVTRGLVGLANTEAELASVLAHEIGHVTARHPAQRLTQAQLATGLAVLLGATVGVPGEVLQLGSAAYLQNYSRGQEFEADILGVRYLTRAGYEPTAVASFLASLQADDALEAEIAGRRDAAPAFDFMASHPRTADRVAQAAAEATSVGLAGPRETGRERYLAAIDGLLYGDDPEQGFIRGRTFLHPSLGFRFDAPPGWRLRNTQRAVLGEDPGGPRFVFDAGSLSPGVDPAAYLATGWARGVRLAGVERLTVNGLPAATAVATLEGRGRAYGVRLVVIRASPTLAYRFAFLSPGGLTPAADRTFRDTALSFRLLTPTEAASLAPRRIRVVAVRPGDTLASLAQRMPEGDLKLERFLVLNGLRGDEVLRPGEAVKLLTP